MQVKVAGNWFPLFRMIASSLFVVASIVSAQNQQESQNRSSKDASRIEGLEQARPVMFQWLGLWVVNERHVGPSGETLGEARGVEEIRPVLEDRAIRRIYRSGGASEPYVAEATFTWNQAEGVFHGFWLDNRSVNGPTVSRGTWNAQTRTMVYDMTQADAAGRTERFRVVERFIDDKHRTATTYRLRGKELIKVLEVDYVLSGPCPEHQSDLRIIMDGVE